MKKIIDAVFSKPITFIAVLSVIINVCIEVLSRDSLSSFLSYITQSPITFLCNTAIIMLTLSVSLLFKRRIFIISAITILWVALGIANKFMLVSGNTPLTIFHIANFGSAIKLSNVHLSRKYYSDFSIFPQVPYCKDFLPSAGKTRRAFTRRVAVSGNYSVSAGIGSFTPL